MVWNPAEERYARSPGKDAAAAIFNEPHTVGITRDVELARPGSWGGSLFNYRPPQFGFSRGEQRLLFSAFSGMTDGELSDDLGKSLSTIKNTWRSIYNRVAECLPELVPDDSHANAQNSDRGRESAAVCWLTSASIPKNFVRCRKSFCSRRGIRPNIVPICHGDWASQ